MACLCLSRLHAWRVLFSIRRRCAAVATDGLNYKLPDRVPVGERLINYIKVCSSRARPGVWQISVCSQMKPVLSQTKRNISARSLINVRWTTLRWTRKTLPNAYHASKYGDINVNTERWYQDEYQIVDLIPFLLLQSDWVGVNSVYEGWRLLERLLSQQRMMFWPSLSERW